MEGLILLCSTDFLWGAELPDIVRLLARSGCEGVVISTDPPYYLPSLLHRSVTPYLRSISRESDIVIAVRSPSIDVNLFSANPYIAEATIKSIEEGIKLAHSIAADFVIIRPSSSPQDENPSLASRKLQVIVSRLFRDQYAAFELIGSNSKEIADGLMNPKLGVVYIHGSSPRELLAHRKLVGVAVHISEDEPLRVIPGLRGDTPYLLLYPDERKMFKGDELGRMILKAKNWRDNLINLI